MSEKNVTDAVEEVSMASDSIVIKGAREHNLRDIDVNIPRDKLVDITGL